ncbi:MAG: hypothetical protein GY804_15045, partial [Alphaproteobacteria bacterium]|nr:hypothetical protein [Alphaproteobacteria bacterium]
MTIHKKVLKIGELYPRLSVKNLGLLLAIYDLGSVSTDDLCKITGDSLPNVRDQLNRCVERNILEFFNVGCIRHHRLTKEARLVLDEVN